MTNTITKGSVFVGSPEDSVSVGTGVPIASPYKTAGEFEKAYAERSGVSVEILHQYGRFGRPCDCGDPMCEGWEMAHTEPENADAVPE